MFWIACSGNDRSDSRIRQHIFQEKLGPAAGELARPIGDWLAAHRPEQTATTKRQSRQHSRSYIRCQRENTFLCVAEIDRIVDLHEIGLFVPKHGLNSR